jgi:glutaredoxin 2
MAQAQFAKTDAAVGPGLALYQFDSCPFCARVRRAADDLGIELELRDTLADPDNARAVVEATGRRTVPVLRIEGDEGDVEWLPESADIVRYLRDRFENRA